MSFKATWNKSCFNVRLPQGKRCDRRIFGRKFVHVRFSSLANWLAEICRAVGRRLRGEQSGRASASRLDIRNAGDSE